MTTNGNAFTHIRNGREPPDSPAPGAGRRNRRLGLAVLSVAVLATVVALLAAVGVFNGHAAGLTNCAAKPSTCGYPDATNTGVPAGTTLKSVPSQVSSGPGWAYNATTDAVVVKVNGTVLSDLNISSNLTISASNVTVKNVQVVTDGTFGISLTHTTGVTIENSTISGQNATTGRVDSAIKDVYGDSTGMVIKDNNISRFRTAMQLSNGLVDGNYIHDPGYIAGDHTNGVVSTGGTKTLVIQNNTIFNSIGQTDAISVNSAKSGMPVANQTIQNNLIAGGGYAIYGGTNLGNTTSNIVIKGNRFAQIYYPKSGQFGPVAYFASTGKGNVWSGNIWDTTGQTVP
jgi:hypothetical protein